MKTLRFFYLIAACCLFASCEKYLDLQPKGRLVPTTTDDFRKLLDNNQTMNVSAGLSELASDNLHFSDVTIMQLGTTFEKNTYLWAKNIFSPLDQVPDWNIPYKQIYNANLVLEGLAETTAGSERDRQQIKGEALFFRAYALHSVASQFAKLYDPATAASTPGVPIRLGSNVFEKSTRPTLKETYDQVFKDLEEALPLLPVTTEYKTRPARPAAYALLARIYLSMANYPKALENAEAALALNDRLFDYNTADPFDFPVFPKFNSEMLFYSVIPYDIQYTWVASISEELYGQYEDNDLRKSLFFMAYENNGQLQISFGGSYGNFDPFTGIANDEVYLTAAECYARAGKLPEALEYLNALLEKRYAAGTFTPFASTDERVVLQKILNERRKELVFRNLRWADLKRLNTENRFAVTLSRTIGGTTHTLAPNDPKYVFPIPQNVIEATGMEQNVR